MQIMKITCGTCSGFGKETVWKAVPLSENSNIGTMSREEFICGVCGGLGYTEYALFDLEEADVIMKHCGLKK